MVAVLRRLLAKIRQIGLKIKHMLLDRAFFNVRVVEFLQQEELPFLMPVVIRGRKPKKGRPATGLRWIKRQPAGWYSHTMKSGKRQVSPECLPSRVYLAVRVVLLERGHFPAGELPVGREKETPQHGHLSELGQGADVGAASDGEL